jgi:two-component system sensor histidine kinase/response regulator
MTGTRPTEEPGRDKSALERRADGIFMALTEGVVVIDADGIVEAINAAGEDILGATAKLMVGHELLSLPWIAHERDGRPLVRENHPIMAALRTGLPQPERLLRYPRPDGREVWVAVAARALVEPDGRVAGAVSSFRDVSDQKMAQRALRESEAQYRALFEHNATVQLIVEAETGVMVAANPAATAFYGIPSEQLVGQHASLLSRTDQDSAVPLRDQIVAGRVTALRRRHYLASGEAREVELYSSPVTIDGRVVLHTFVMDVTARIEAEAARRRLAAILDLTPDIVGMFDLEGQLFYTNRAGRQLLGLPALEGEATGEAMADIPRDAIRMSNVDPDAEQILAETIAVAAAEGISWGEITLRGGDGEARIVSQVMMAHRDEDGRASHFSTILRDVSEMRRTQLLLREQAEELEMQTEELAHQTEELLAARDAAETANSAKSRFLTHMSHELRTPLTAIIGFSRVLEANRQGHLSTQEVAYAQRLSANAVRLLDLINQLLDLSKVEAGHMAIEWTSVDVAALAREVVADLQGRDRAPDLAFTASTPDVPAMVPADETKLRQVIVNLVGNALKFTEKGSVDVVVQVDESGTPLSLEVRDTGVGIAPAHQQAVFEPFAQEDVSITRRFGGTGLGLAISKQFCEMMGFVLELESTPGQGSTFRVRFPGGGSLPV